MIHIGNLTVTTENVGDYITLTKVTGGLYVHEGATLTAPNLKTKGEK